jgi:hypothetical protein
MLDVIFATADCVVLSQLQTLRRPSRSDFYRNELILSIMNYFCSFGGVPIKPSLLASV